jgi:L-asparaginase II
MDADGALAMSLGDIEQPVFPRSAIKSIQALPFVESGAADAYGFGDREIALACASHSGQTEHAALAASMLEAAGLDHSALECGTHWPMQQGAALELARSGGKPSALHNNCSGKHSGFVCTCKHLGINYRGYVGAEHESQKMVRDAMESITGAAHRVGACGTDGCSIPTYAVPLKNFALGFARMATGNGLAPERAKAARRIFSACMAEPFFVAGTERLDTDLMSAANGRIMIKVGAEGVYCGAIPELGLGIAIKADDGAGRACETMVAAVLARLLAHDGDLAATLLKFANPVFRNWNGIEVGGMRPTDAFR